MADFVLESLRGGLEDTTPISALPKDACQMADNVEFFVSTLGERRNGTEVFPDLPAGITGNASFSAVAWMFVHEPSSDPLLAELWVMTVDAGNINPLMFRYASGAWTSITFADAPTTGTDLYGFYGLSFHGKLYIAYNSAQDRLHVWPGSGTVIRRVGLAVPAAAPTVADTGAGAYPAVLRYYATRYTRVNGSIIEARSESSPSTAFTPSGGGTAARVTNFAGVGTDSPTHWEVYASTDNVTFYRLASIVIGTTTYDDSALVATYSSNPQSDPAGSYSTVPSAKYLAADNDRILLGSSHETAADRSAVQWTPVGNDPLPGADERINSNFDPRIDLDGREGGDITALGHSVSGLVYGFKWGAIYRIARTGQLVGSYEASPVTKSRGALPRSVVEANDEEGRPVLYFLDPEIGCMRIGATALQWVGYGVNGLWRTVNTSATIPCHGVFYSLKNQLHYWVAAPTDIASQFPTAKIVLQINEVRFAAEGARRGWSIVSASEEGIGRARCSAMYWNPVVSSIAPAVTFVPFIGMGDAVEADCVQICDTGSDDNGVEYIAAAESRPFFLENITNRHGILSAALLGTRNSAVVMTLVRDFGVEEKSSTGTFTPVGGESHVIAQLDDLSLAELYATSIRFEDPEAGGSFWELFQAVLKEKPEQTG